MIASQLSEHIGKTVELTVNLGKDERLTIPCTIVDAREVWGRKDYRLDYNGQLVWSSEYHVKLSRDNELIMNGSIE